MDRTRIERAERWSRWLAQSGESVPRLDESDAVAGFEGYSGELGRGVRGLWGRHNLLIKHDRLLRLEREASKRKLTLTEEQIRLLERFWPEFRERHIETCHTGDLVAIETFFRNVLRGHPQTHWESLSAVSDRLLFSVCLGPAAHEQAAGDGGACA